MALIFGFVMEQFITSIQMALFNKCFDTFCCVKMLHELSLSHACFAVKYIGFIPLKINNICVWV